MNAKRCDICNRFYTNTIGGGAGRGMAFYGADTIDICPACCKVLGLPELETLRKDSFKYTKQSRAAWVKIIQCAERVFEDIRG